MTATLPSEQTVLTGLKPLVTTVFVPAAIFGIGQGAAAPIMAVTARDLGASIAVAGVIVALGGLGAVLGDLPAGLIVSRFGERRSIIGGSALGATGVVICLAAPTPWILGIGAVLTGLANAVWGLARQSYLAETVPLGLRARAMSSFAAMWRLGFFLGPLIGVGVIVLVGTRGGFLVQLAGVVLAGALMARVPDSRRQEKKSQHVRLPDILSRHRAALSTLGAGALLMGAARASREVVLPLWALHLGLDAAQVSLIFGIGAAVDLLCSYPAGHIMDRYGRRVVAVPSLIVIGAAYLFLPFAAGVAGLTAVAVVMGIGNGLGNGIIMTLGADIAPSNERAEFLAAWRLTHDLGMFGGPMTVGLLAAAVPLGFACATMGMTSFAGAVMMYRFIPVYSPWTGRPHKHAVQGSGG